jgi:hypothetical protein
MNRSHLLSLMDVRRPFLLASFCGLLAACDQPPSSSQPEAERQTGTLADGPEATVEGCLSGEFGPFDEVASWQVAQGIHLYCGDHTKGIIHIDAGHGPLTGNNQFLFLDCLDRVFFSGRRNGVGATPGTHVWQFDYFDRHSGQALALVRDSDGYVLTAYANRGAQSNDWGGCVRGTR